ncbi:hypothetical protein [Limnovirga soli]|uniref:Glycoside hydrolase family 42 N-terminal domain-containing protein n=1 Tax=Limnovirga soli TaxID=2656915 RepID=A0A8J8JVK2_9BACT|nr:hypothetical protein [Limnovirga soli]NNV57470.1 hypothetical protein [Limnovirga soli]
MQTKYKTGSPFTLFTLLTLLSCSLTFCSGPNNNTPIADTEKIAITQPLPAYSRQTTTKDDSILPPKNLYGVWGGGELSHVNAAEYPFFKGWYIIRQWKEIEPAKDSFAWAAFDEQVQYATTYHLAIGFMIWAGPHAPDWLYAYGVPKVSTDTRKKEADFPYYLSPVYKERYFNMLKKTAEHIHGLPAAQRNNIVMWMSAEGSTGDITPYKGRPINDKYNISEEDWTHFKKEVWTYMYQVCQTATPRINLLVNQGNDGRYFNWLMANMPNVWMKAGNISHTYQFNGEQEYYNRLQKLDANIQQDSSANRTRGEITVSGKWFNTNESWNMYALISSCLHFGLDIFNTSPKYIKNPADTVSFNFFNFYAGHKVAATSPGAFCVLKDALDAADLNRFPESKYGPLIDPDKKEQYNKEMDRKSKKEQDVSIEEADQGIRLSDIRNNYLSPQRIEKILAEYAPYGAQRGNIAEDSDTTNMQKPEIQKPKKKGKSPNRQGRNTGKQNPDKEKKKSRKEKEPGQLTNYQKNREANMVINDIGVNLLPDNYYRFLVQYSPNTTSRGYWRVGPADAPYGRFARGFDASNGMTEMLFALDKNFFSGNTLAQPVLIKVIYLDKGKGSWALNYFAGTKKQAYQVQCNNSGKWIIKTIILKDAIFTHQLPHSCDVSISYINGDNTIFNSIEIIRQ